ncbi:MAG: NfeD family protein [Oscillospiraceae bacterium]|jgi:membrane protein implicated in regulation of membrane protease activity|nr:NfeD family protein [Oscillospiraceae bacterium]
MPKEAIVWLVFIIAAGSLEAVTQQIVSIWFAVAALFAFVGALLGLPTAVNIALFTVASCALLAALRPIAYRLIRTPARERPAPNPTNADRAVGGTALVLSDVGGGKVGAVKILGLEWSAVPDGDLIIRAGELARVVAIEGVKLVVEPAREPAAAVR